MFSISSVKKQAKANLRTNYGKSLGWPGLLAVLTSMIMIAITLPLAALYFSGISASLIQQLAMFNVGELTSLEVFAAQQDLINVFADIFGKLNIFYALCNFLVMGNAAAGTCYFFLKIYENNDAVGSDIFSGYRKYFHVLAGMVLRSIFTALWSILLIIPGIIKYYSYYFTSYILIDRPELGALDAIKLSIDLTRGNKMKIFIAQLSFIGWAVLSIATFGLAFIFYVSPYYQITMAGIYSKCRGFASAGKETFDPELAAKNIPYSLKTGDRANTSLNSMSQDYYATGFIPLNAKKTTKENTPPVNQKKKDTNDEFNEFLNNIKK